MTTRFFNAPFGPLLSVASVMCGFALPSAESLAAEWEKRPNRPDVEILRNAGKLSSSMPAASINEARWATPPGEYFLGASGEVVPVEIGIDESSIGALRSSGGNVNPVHRTRTLLIVFLRRVMPPSNAVRLRQRPIKSGVWLSKLHIVTKSMPLSRLRSQLPRAASIDFAILPREPEVRCS